MNFIRQGKPPEGQRWSLYADHLGNYMHRWILLTPFGMLRLHHILRSDKDRHLHDHPFDFTSILLTGGYTEMTLHPLTTHPWASEMLKAGRVQFEKFWPRFSVIRKTAEEAHRLLLDEPLWTFVIAGPKRRSWGFYTEEGWVDWREYASRFPEIVKRRFGEEA